MSEGLSYYPAAFLKGLPHARHAYARGVGPTQTFALISWGAAATTWLSRVLDSHPEIFCAHALNDVWHRFGDSQRWTWLGGGKCLDGLRYLRILSVYGYFYRVVGDVHGVSRHEVPSLREAYGKYFNAAVLVREPIHERRTGSLVRLPYRPRS